MKRALIAAGITAMLTGSAFAADDFRTHFMESWDGNGDGKITLEEVTERRETVFRMFDADEDGYLTAPELAQMDDVRATEHAGMDGAGPGQGGMGQGMQKGMGKGHGQGMGHGQGKGQGMGRMQQAAENGMHNRGMIDADGDGKVSKDEFVGMSGQWFARMDGNGDQVIDKADF